MTAVARFAIRDYPLLIGDLLLSGRELPGFSPVLPTMKDLSMHFPPGSDPVPRALSQKIVVVADNLVVGWAGKYSTARDVVSELRRLSVGTSFTKDSLDDFFDSLSGAVWKDIGLLGFLREGDRVGEFRRNGREVRTQLYGNVGLIGSGRVDIERFIGTGQMPGGLERPMNALEQSLGYGLYLTGTFLNLEQVTGESLTRYYGGGYEIASLMGDKFGKMGDVTYIFWTARADDGNPRLYKQPSRLFRYAYERDLLVIRAFAFEGSPPAPTARDDLHYVTPIYRDPTPTERGWVDDPYSGPAPSLDASWLCNYILTALPNGKVGVLTLVCLKAPGQDRWVRIKETAGGTEIMVSDEFINLVSRQIEEQLTTMT